MRTEYLNRFAATQDGTLGRWGPWAALEEEDQGNQVNISSVLAGTYVCVRHMFHGYETFRLKNVPGRSGIVIHRLNTEEGTEGCIGLGMNFGVMEVSDEDSGIMTHKLAIRDSRIAHDEFMAYMEGVDTFALVITDYNEEA